MLVPAFALVFNGSGCPLDGDNILFSPVHILYPEINDGMTKYILSVRKLINLNNQSVTSLFSLLSV